MKKWFEYLEKNYKDSLYECGSVSAPVYNVYDQMRDDFDYIKQIYDTPQVSKRMHSNFSEDYLDTLAIPGLSKEILEEWIYDPEFDHLLNLPSHEAVYFHEPNDYSRLINNFTKAMGINDFVAKKNLGAVKLHVQHPGQIFPLHFDRPQHSEFNIATYNLTQKPSHQRFLVFMEDIKPGQLFQMDYDTLHWKAGDVYTWDARNTMHGSANIGFWRRWMMMFTFKLKED